LEKYPKANAVKSADSAQQIIGWKTFFTFDGNLKENNSKNESTSNNNLNCTITVGNKISIA